MARRLGVILGLLVLTLSGCADPPAPDPAPPREWDLDTYVFGSAPWQPSVALPVPGGWRERRHGSDRVDYTDPTGLLVLRYTVTPHSPGDPVELLRSAATDYDDYTLVRIEPATFGPDEPGRTRADGAVWEFRYRAGDAERAATVGGFHSPVSTGPPHDLGDYWITMSFFAPAEKHPTLVEPIFWDRVARFDWPF